MIDNYLLCRASELPDGPGLLAALQSAGLDVEFEKPFSPRQKKERFVACRFEGLVSGFDYAVRAYEEDMFELKKKQIKIVGDRRTLVHLCTYSNAQEIAGSASVIAVLANLTEGVLLAEFEDDLILGGAAMAWLRDSMPNIREQFSGPCKMRGHNMKDVPRISVLIDVEK